MRNLGQNMAWLLNTIENDRQKGRLPPESEFAAKTNFIR